MNEEIEEFEFAKSNLELALIETEYTYIIEWYEGYTFFGYHSLRDAQSFENYKNEKEQLIREQILLKDIEDTTKEIDLSFLLEDKVIVSTYTEQSSYQHHLTLYLILLAFICIVVLLMIRYRLRYHAQ